MGEKRTSSGAGGSSWTVIDGPNDPLHKAPADVLPAWERLTDDTERVQRDECWQHGVENCPICASQRTARPADPDWWYDVNHVNGPTMPQYWYHGTSLPRAKYILREGLRPWDDVGHTNYGNESGESQWVEPRPGHTYLTNSVSIARQHSGNHSDEIGHRTPGAVLKIDPRYLDPERINPDEDNHPAFGGIDPKTPEQEQYYLEMGNPDTLGQLAEWEGYGDEPSQTHPAIEHSGTLAYRGAIPPEAISLHLLQDDPFQGYRQATEADYPTTNPNQLQIQAGLWDDLIYAGVDCPQCGSPDTIYQSDNKLRCNRCRNRFNPPDLFNMLPGDQQHTVDRARQDPDMWYESKNYTKIVEAKLAGEMPLFHVAPADLRDQIEQEGLRAGNKQWPLADYEPGVYAWDNLDDARRYVKQVSDAVYGKPAQGHDIYQVTGAPAAQDQFSAEGLKQMGYQGNAYKFHPEVVPPEFVQHVEHHGDPWQGTPDLDQWKKRWGRTSGLMDYSEPLNPADLLSLREYPWTRDYNRGNYGAEHDLNAAHGYWDTLRDDIAQNGFQDPVTLEYNPNTGKGYIGEGNHRIGIAHELGIQVPTMVYRSTKDDERMKPMHEPGTYRMENERGYSQFPQYAKPSMIGLGDNQRTAAATRNQLLRDKACFEQENEPDQSKVVHQFPDGWTVRQPISPNDHYYEGYMMGNCVSDYASEMPEPDEPMEALGGGVYHSLRDPDNIPHATWEQYGPGNTGLALGRHNSPVKPKYAPYLDEFGVSYDTNNTCAHCDANEAMEGSDWCEPCLSGDGPAVDTRPRTPGPEWVPGSDPEEYRRQVNEWLRQGGPSASSEILPQDPDSQNPQTHSKTRTRKVLTHPDNLQPSIMYHVGRPGQVLGQPPVFLWSDLDAAQEYSQGTFPIYEVDVSGLDLQPDQEYDPGIAYFTEEPVDPSRFSPQAKQSKTRTAMPYMPPGFQRINLGHYETPDGRFMLYRLQGVTPPAWNVEDTETLEIIVDGAASIKDAVALFEQWQQQHQSKTAAYEEHDEMLANGTVHARFEVTDTDIIIVEWSSLAKGQGNTKQAIAELRVKYPGKKVVAFDVDTLNARPYWEHMGEQGLVDDITNESGESEWQRGSKTAAQPNVMYHVSPVAAREQIEANGLVPQQQTVWPGTTPGVYLWPDLERARNYSTLHADTGGADIWAVNTEPYQEHLQSDPAKDQSEAYRFDQPVHPHWLTHLERHTDYDPSIEGYRSLDPRQHRETNTSGLTRYVPRTAAGQDPDVPSPDELQGCVSPSECYYAAMRLANQYPQLEYRAGDYIDPRDPRPGNAHAWVETPSGTVIDPTHGQFEADKPLIIAPHGHEYRERYQPHPDHEADWAHEMPEPYDPLNALAPRYRHNKLCNNCDQQPRTSGLLWCDDCINKWRQENPDEGGDDEPIDLGPSRTAAAAPIVMYHYAPTESRESIMQHGLDASRGQKPELWDDTQYPQANYLYTSLDHTDQFSPSYISSPAIAHGRDHDVYEVNVDGLNVQPDPLHQQTRMVTEPIEPARLKLLGTENAHGGWTRHSDQASSQVWNQVPQPSTQSTPHTRVHEGQSPDTGRPVDRSATVRTGRSNLVQPPLTRRDQRPGVRPTSIQQVSTKRVTSPRNVEPISSSHSVHKDSHLSKHETIHTPSLTTHSSVSQSLADNRKRFNVYGTGLEIMDTLARSAQWSSPFGTPDGNPRLGTPEGTGHKLLWEPGDYGRGQVLPDGSVHTWPEDWETHGQHARRGGFEGWYLGEGQNHRFNISPEGVFSYWPSVDVEQVVAADPRLTPGRGRIAGVPTVSSGRDSLGTRRGGSVCPQCGDKMDLSYDPTKMWNPQFGCECGYKHSIPGENNQIGTPYTDAERNQMWQDVVTSPNRDPMFINPQNWNFGQPHRGSRQDPSLGWGAWQPGAEGRGLLAQDGTVHHWECEQDEPMMGFPNHVQWTNGTGVKPAVKFFISPIGEISEMRDADPQQKQQIYDAHPDFRPQRQRVASNLPPDRIWRGESRPVGEDPSQAASVGMHWTEDPSVALVNYRDDEPDLQNVMWQARRNPASEISAGHPIWQGKGRPMSWEREVRLMPGQQAQIEGHYTWQGEGTPKPFTLREHGENYNPNWVWTPAERSVPVEHKGWIPYQQRHPDLFKSGAVTGMDEQKWEGLVKRACKIAEDDGIDVAGDWLFDQSGEIALSADFMSQYSKVFADNDEEPVVDHAENVRERPEADHQESSLAAVELVADEATDKADQSTHIDDRLARLTDIVAQLAQPADPGQKKKLVVKRDGQGRIASIEEE